MGELDRLEKDVLEELKDRLLEDPLTDDNIVSDWMFEIADSHCPIYNYDILQLAADNIFLALDEPENGPAFGGESTPINIIAANIYEHLYQLQWENLEDIREEVKDELMTCEECGDIIDDDRLIGHDWEEDDQVKAVCVDCYDDTMLMIEDDNQILP